MTQDRPSKRGKVARGGGRVYTAEEPFWRHTRRAPYQRSSNGTKRRFIEGKEAKGDGNARGEAAGRRTRDLRVPGGDRHRRAPPHDRRGGLLSRAAARLLRRRSDAGLARGRGRGRREAAWRHVRQWRKRA